MSSSSRSSVQLPPPAFAPSAGAPSAGACWRWQRPIPSAQQDAWLARLAERGIASWSLLERPGYARLSLQAYFNRRRDAEALAKTWGGRVTPLPAASWLHPGPTPPLRVAPDFYIVHEAAQKTPGARRLHLPFGVAFGSGEHATTLLLLRALIARGAGGVPILDLGTGSGVLALAARLLGATRIVATDFDPNAIRTARQNEKLNFPQSRIDWRRADVLRLREKCRYGLVLANLFCGVLIRAAPRIAASLLPGGELWLSGVLRAQAAEVATAYRRKGLNLIRTVHRGKWVMQQWRKKSQLVGGGVSRTT